ncbi:MAG: TIM-barrel domain-containing protein, partial [Alphaproteobacteria bacterium]
AIVEADPWRLRFTAADGTALLEESTARDEGSAGAVGFRSEGRWSHATRAIGLARQPDGSIEAQVETDDPRGRRLHVVVSRDGGEGVIAVAVEVRDLIPPDDPLAGAWAPPPPLEAVGVAWDASTRGESFYGFGERANRVQHRGEAVESYVSDGPWQSDEYQLMSGILPPPGFRPRDDATYFPIPWLLSSRGYGVLVDADETVVHRLGTDREDAWSFEVRGAPEDLAFRPAPSRVAFRVFGGPAPADVLARYTNRVGRQPRVRAPWVFGPWYQGSEEGVRALRDADAPVSVSQTYLHYLPCGGSRANEWPRNERLHALGVAVTTYFNPMVCQSYEAAFSKAAEAGGLIKDATGSPYIYTYFTTRPFLVSQYDFSADAGRRAFGDMLSQAVEDGHDGWMEDFGEYTPFDAVTADGRDGSATHNAYVRDYHCAGWRFAREQDRPIVRFQRSGWTGAARCAQVVWGGDPTTGWGFDGLASVVRAGLGMGLSGVSAWGSDTGGFFSFYGRKLDDELLRRWVQLGAFSGVMRTERDGIAIPDYERPQV